MTPDLQHLLEKAATSGLTAKEESELALLLENPANRQTVERETAALRKSIGIALTEGGSSATFPSAPSDAQRQRFDHAITKLREQKTKAHRPSLSRTLRFAALVAAAAAVALWLSPRGSLPLPAAESRIELAVIAQETTHRSARSLPPPALGSDWRLIEVKDLGALAQWARQTLPADVKARIWIDEEAGVLRGVARGADGTIKQASRAFNPAASTEEQLLRFAQTLRAP